MSNVSGYYVYKNTNPTPIANLPGANNTAYTATNLTASTQYQFTVTSYDSANVQSPRTSNVTVTTSSGPSSGTPYPRYGAYAIDSFVLNSNPSAPLSEQGYPSYPVAERLSRCHFVILAGTGEFWQNSIYPSLNDFVNDIKARSALKGTNTKVVIYTNFNEMDPVTPWYPSIKTVNDTANWYLYEHGLGSPSHPGTWNSNTNTATPDGSYPPIVRSTWDSNWWLINMAHINCPTYPYDNTTGPLFPYQYYAKWTYEVYINNKFHNGLNAPSLDGFFVDNGFLYPRVNYPQPADMTRANISLSWPDGVKSAWSGGIVDFFTYGRQIGPSKLWGCNSPYDGIDINATNPGAGLYYYANQLDLGIQEFAIGVDTDYGTVLNPRNPCYEFYVSTGSEIKLINDAQTYMFRNGADSYNVICCYGLDNTGKFPQYYTDSNGQQQVFYGTQTPFQSLRYVFGLITMTDAYFYDTLQGLPGVCQDPNTDVCIRIWDELVGGALNTYGWLGSAVDSRQSTPRSESWSGGTVFARRFANGAVFVNTRQMQGGATIATQTIPLTNPFGDGVNYQRLQHTSASLGDPTVNDGSTNNFSLHSGDGIFLIKITQGTSDTTAPSVPAGLSATAGSSTSINLSWSASTDNVGGSGVNGYNLYRSSTAGGSYTKINNIIITATYYTDSGLSTSTTYYYKVSAVDNASNESATSSSVSGTTSSTSSAALRINAGGPAYLDSSSKQWAADTGYSNSIGTANWGTQAIVGTSDPTLYRTERYGSNMQYTFTVPNGTYQVTLYFAENYLNSGFPNSGIGQRIFSVQANGTTIVSNIDLMSVAGPHVAVTRTSTVTVTTGQIVLSFTSTINNALINAIEITATTSVSGAFAPASHNFPRLACGSFNNITDWKNSAVYQKMADLNFVWLTGGVWQDSRSLQDVVSDIKGRSTVDTKVGVYQNFDDAKDYNNGGWQNYFWWTVNQNPPNWWVYQQGTSGARTETQSIGSQIYITNPTHYSPRTSGLPESSSYARSPNGLYPYQFAAWYTDQLYQRGPPAGNIPGWTEPSTGVATNLDAYFVDNVFAYPEAGYVHPGQTADIKRGQAGTGNTDDYEWRLGESDFMTHGHSIDPTRGWGGNWYSRREYSTDGTFRNSNLDGKMDHAFWEHGIGIEADPSGVMAPNWEGWQGTDAFLKQYQYAMDNSFRPGFNGYFLICCSGVSRTNGRIDGIDPNGAYKDYAYLNSTSDFQGLRYTLGAVSMGNGYWCDQGYQGYQYTYFAGATRRWDETHGGALNTGGWLGQPTEGPQYSVRPAISGQPWTNGTVYARRFTNGAVFLNRSRAGTVSINLDNPFGDGVAYKRLSSYNNGGADSTGYPRGNATINNGQGGTYNLPGGDAIFVLKI